MGIDKLIQINQLPVIDKDEILSGGLPAVVEYLSRLVHTLQDTVLRDLMTVVNNQLFVTDEGVFYFDLPDANGLHIANDHRLIKVDGGIELQIYDGDDWLSGTDSMARWVF